MSWPFPHEFNEAIQNPRLAFSDPDLQGCEAVVGANGLPLPRSGNFADVYHLRGGGRDWAVKCFTRPAIGLAERYAQVSEALSRAHFPFTVHFSYLAAGIRIGNEWRPAVKMDWVEGLQLNQVVRENAGRPGVLSALLQMWPKLCRRLREAGIAHADIQHGNVLLVPGSRSGTYGLKLIDYDGMYVPALANVPSGEFGHPAYQHPHRARERVYSLDVDRFPHLVIATALKGLEIVGPELWTRYDTGDNLLFIEEDFHNPAGSRLMKELWGTQNPSVQAFVARLALSCANPLEETPWLDQIAPDGEPGVLDVHRHRAALELLALGRPIPVGLLPESASAGVIQPFPSPTAPRDLVDVAVPAGRDSRWSSRSTKLMLASIASLALLLGAVVGGMELFGSKSTSPDAAGEGGHDPDTALPKGIEGSTTGSAAPEGEQPGVPKRVGVESEAGSNVREIPASPVLFQAPNPTSREEWSGRIAGGQRFTHLFVDLASDLVLLGDPEGAFAAFELGNGNRRGGFAGLANTGTTYFFRLDGARLASAATSPEEIAIWNARTGQRMETIAVPDLPRGGGQARFIRAKPSPNGEYLVVARSGPPTLDNPEVPFHIVQPHTGKRILLTTWRGGSAHFTADSARVLVAEWSGRFRWFKLPSGEPDGAWELGSPPKGRWHTVHGVAGDGSAIAYTGPAGLKGGAQSPAILDGRTGAVIRQFNDYFPASELSISDDGRRIALMRDVTADSCTVDVLDVPSGDLIRRVQEVSERYLVSFQLAGDGRTLLMFKPAEERLQCYRLPRFNEQ